METNSIAAALGAISTRRSDPRSDPYDYRFAWVDSEDDGDDENDRDNEDDEDDDEDDEDNSPPRCYVQITPDDERRERERYEASLKKFKEENEGFYKDMMQRKDSDETIMKQWWHLAEMRCPPHHHPIYKSSKSYEKVMEKLKQNRDTRRPFLTQLPGAEDKIFEAGDIRAADEAKHESSCWDYFRLPIEFHRCLLRFYAAEAFDKAHAVQISALKLTREGGRVDDSLHVYGMMHLYSSYGSRYQVIFNRKREDCQILTKMDPYLHLTGPALPPILEEDGMRIQGTLKLKSTTRSEDTFLTVSLSPGQGKKHNFKEGDVGFQSQDTTGKHYLLEMTRCIVVFSVVATISVKVKQGVLPSDCRFTAFTASLQDMKVVLLDSKYGKVHTDVNGTVQLSRCTVIVDWGGTLKVVVERGGIEIAPLDFPFVDVKEGSVKYNIGNIKVTDSCTLEVLVKWSSWWDRFKQD